MIVILDKFYNFWLFVSKISILVVKIWQQFVKIVLNFKFNLAEQKEFILSKKDYFGQNFAPKSVNSEGGRVENKIVM